MYRILSCSLRSGSHSRLLAEQALEDFKAQGQEAELIDMAEYSLPYADGETDFSSTVVSELAEKIHSATGLLVATPIYNYGVNAVLKSLIELTGRQGWVDQRVGFLCAAGGQSSYMAIMPFANSLMLDFRCLIVPRFVYCSGGSFQDGRLVDEKIKERTHQVVEALIHLCRP